MNGVWVEVLFVCFCSASPTHCCSNEEEAQLATHGITIGWPAL